MNNYLVVSIIKILFMRKQFCIFFIVSCMVICVQAQPAPNDTIPVPAPLKSVTKHSITINGKTINYTATAGALILKNEKDEQVAFFGYTAYTKDGETDATKRPVTFCYNGGPGSSSMWLHLGVIGPKHVVVNDPYDNPPPPYK